MVIRNSRSFDCNACTALTRPQTRTCTLPTIKLEESSRFTNNAIKKRSDITSYDKGEKGTKKKRLAGGRQEDVSKSGVIH